MYMSCAMVTISNSNVQATRATPIVQRMKRSMHQFGMDFQGPYHTGIPKVDISPNYLWQTWMVKASVLLLRVRMLDLPIQALELLERLSRRDINAQRKRRFWEKEPGSSSCVSYIDSNESRPVRCSRPVFTTASI